MNLRIVLHLFKTDWQRLKWLVVVCWILMLFAAWPAISFDPASFDTPLQLQIPPNIHLTGDIQEAMEKQGEISRLADWRFLSIHWLLTATSLLLAGALGFHALGWTAARPARRRETIAAKGAGLTVFLLLPLLALVASVMLAHGSGASHALRSASMAAAILIPRVLGVCLFGALCGAWWPWLAGMFALIVTSSALTSILTRNLASVWYASPIAATGFPVPLAPLWVAVAAPLVLLLSASRHLKAARRIAIAIFAMLLIPTWLPQPKFPARLTKTLPDWSATVKPVLANLELNAQVYEDASSSLLFDDPMFYDDPFHRSTWAPHAELRLKWETDGLPQGVFANWVRAGSGELAADGVIISSGIRPKQKETSGQTNPLGYDVRALKSALTSESKPIQLKEIYSQTDGCERLDLFEALEPGFHNSTTLRADLAGTAYRMEKVLDVPFGSPVETTANGTRLHIRRLDLTKFVDLSVRDHPFPINVLPIVDVSFISSVPWQPLMPYRGYLGLPGADWLVFLHLPATGEFRMLRMIHQVAAPLSPGCVAARLWYMTDNLSSGQQPDLSGFETARLVVLKRVNLGHMRREFQSDPLPLLVTRRGPSDGSERTGSPQMALRPDPATASAQDLNTWINRSYDVFDQTGWDSRNIAEFVPRYLDWLLARDTTIHPPSSPEGKAITLACPESRRDEVLAALLRRNKDPISNWLPDVILKRGWNKEAAPVIRKMLDHNGIDRNPYSLMLLASLENPQFYPAILAAAKHGLWWEAMEQLRHLPGIEPDLQAAILEHYEDFKKTARTKPPKPNRTSSADPLGDGPALLRQAILPASYGLAGPFADVIAIWRGLNAENQFQCADSMRKIILLPGDPHDWQAVLSNLAGKQTTDFRYDPLARMWRPLT